VRGPTRALPPCCYERRVRLREQPKEGSHGSRAGGGHVMRRPAARGGPPVAWRNRRVPRPISVQRTIGHPPAREPHPSDATNDNRLSRPPPAGTKGRWTAVRSGAPPQRHEQHPWALRLIIRGGARGASGLRHGSCIDISGPISEATTSNPPCSVVTTLVTVIRRNGLNNDSAAPHLD
jgi:hypothetical protein